MTTRLSLAPPGITYPPTGNRTVLAEAVAISTHAVASSAPSLG